MTNSEFARNLAGARNECEIMPSAFDPHALASVRRRLNAGSRADLGKSIGPKLHHIETTCEQSFGHPLDTGIEERLMAHEHECAALDRNNRRPRARSALVEQPFDDIVDLAHKGRIGQSTTEDDLLESRLSHLLRASLIAREVQQLDQIGQI